MKDISTLVTDIESLFNGHECNDILLDDFVTTLRDQIKLSFKQYGEKRQGYLRMSNIGKPCHRQLWYECSSVEPEPLTAATRFKFLFGHIIEALMIYLAKEAGHNVTDEQKQVTLDGIKGSMDCKIDGVLIDVKSTSSRSFDKFKSGKLADDDPFGYIGQIGGYAKAEGTSQVGFLAVDKTLGHICLYMPENLPDPSETIAKVKAAVNSEVPPERVQGATKADGASGNECLSTTCSYCNYKAECFKDANEGKGLRAFSYSNGPRFLTKVVREPNVAELK